MTSPLKSHDDDNCHIPRRHYQFEAAWDSSLHGSPLLNRSVLTAADKTSTVHNNIQCSPYW